MKLSSAIRTALLVLICSTYQVVACGEVVTTFQDAFQLSTPAPGWSYLWNSAGPIGNPANYTPLLPNSAGMYTSGGVEMIPAPAPGSWVFFGITEGVPGGHPGEGTLQLSSGGIARYAIAAYTLPVSGAFELLGGRLENNNPNQGGSTDGVDLKVFLNDQPSPIVDMSTASGTGSYVEFALSLGALAAGDKIYVAVGPREVDSFDGFDLRYTIAVAPEPSAACMALCGLMLIAMRARWK